MRIIFSNQFGCHSRSELILNFPELVNVNREEYDEALAQRWLMTVQASHVKWYQSRSTRVRLSDTDYHFTELDILQDPLPLSLLDDVYTKYCRHKNYKKYFEINEFLPIDKIAGYYYNNSLTAWTKLRTYSKSSIETVLFVWDYANPESHLGLTSLKTEIAWAKKQGHTYFYMGPGYEKNSIYKSDVDGFEWWTGSQWSQDRDEYIWLCKRDSKIASYHQIHSVLANLQHGRSSP